MSSLSARHALPYLSGSQAQKHVTVNEGLRLLDALLHCAVLSATTTAEPSAPQPGDAWILPAGRSGPAWGLMAPGNIAAWLDGSFAEIVPSTGFLAYVRDTGLFILFNGTDWLAIPLSSANVPSFGINTTADTTNRFSVKADAELLSHDDVTPGSGDARKIVNKASHAHAASLVFQTGYSGRAEIGLIGDDQLAFKVSADGATFTEVLRANPATGYLAINRAVADRTLHLGGGSTPGIRTQIDGSSGYGELISTNSGQTLLSQVSPPGESALIDLAPMPSDGTSAAAFRFFRSTNTTHGCYLTVHAGNGTATYNHQLSGKWDSYLQATSGNLRIGSQAAPVCKLDVAGPIRVGSFTVATLPSAAAGAGQIIYVANETGGAVLAFSDGAQWRRSTDRNVVA